MTSNLWTHSGTPPWEYVQLVLCRDIYHCTPLELAKQPWDIIEIHLKLIGVENEVRKMEQNSKKPKGKGKKKPPPPVPEPKDD